MAKTPKTKRKIDGENYIPYTTRKRKSDALKHAQYLRHNQQTKVRVEKRANTFLILRGPKRKKRHLKGPPERYEP